MKILFWCFGIFCGGMLFVSNLTLIATNTHTGWSIVWLVFSILGSLHLTLVIWATTSEAEEEKQSKSYQEGDFEDARYFQENMLDMSDEVSAEIHRRIHKGVQKKMEAYAEEARRRGK